MSRGLLIKIAVVAAILIAMVGARGLYLQKSHFDKAESHYQNGELKLAMREYGTAMKFYVPLSPYVERSAQRLWQMGMTFEESGELLKAHAAYSTLRSSFYASRSLYTPGKEWIRKCDEKLASLRASMLVEEGRITQDEFEAARLRHLRAMQTDKAPKPLWALIAAVSFLGFISSVVYVMFRGFTPEAKLRRKEALAGALVAACSFIMWIISLMMA